ncbi:MAG: 3-hydroxyacyl-ACP dehydratase FabZ family protein [Rhodovarius sp.]|nr:3-hydroxyacyl-ACP dehydratase FabZ family protein [Rhodovarius sp.]
MLDRILARDADSLSAAARLPEHSPVFEGHFPGHPLLPGVLMIECLAQAAGWLMLARQGFARMPLLAKVREAKLRGMLRPGQDIAAEARLLHEGSGYAVLSGRLSGPAGLAAEAEVTLRLLPFPAEDLARLLRARAQEIGL